MCASKMTRVCAHCNKEQGVGTLFKCGGCMMEFYCSKECQRRKWKEHKLMCKQNTNCAGLRSRHKSCLMHTEVLKSLHLIAHKILGNCYNDKNAHVVMTLKAADNGLISVDNASFTKMVNDTAYRMERGKLKRVGKFPNNIVEDISKCDHALVLFFDTGVILVKDHGSPTMLPIPHQSVEWLIDVVNKLIVCVADSKV